MKYLYNIGLALLISLFAYQLAAQTIAGYAYYNEFLEYTLHNLDYIAIMFGSTDTVMFPFIELSNYVSLVPTFLFYIVGVAIAVWHFIRIDRSYHPFLLARLHTQSAFFRYLQKDMFAKVSLYSISYTVICYAIVLLDAPYAKGTITFHEIMMVVLFTLSRTLLLLAIAQLALLFYIQHNAIIAQYSALSFIVLCLIFGMQFDESNVVFYNHGYYFIPSFIMTIIMLLGAFIIKKKTTYQMLGKD